jgi:hypothetical protein
MLNRSQIQLVAAITVVLGVGVACGSDENGSDEKTAKDIGTARITFDDEEFDFELTDCHVGQAEGVGEHPVYGPIRLIVRDYGPNDSYEIVRAPAGEDGPGWFYANEAGSPSAFTLDERRSIDIRLPIYEFADSQSIPDGEAVGALEPVSLYGRLLVLCSLPE